MAKNTIFNNSGVEVTSIGDVEGIMTDLFDKTYYTLNTENNKFNNIKLSFFMAGSKADIDTKSFNQDEINILPEHNTDSKFTYLICYNAENTQQCIVRKVETARMALSFMDAYKSGMFFGNYDIALHEDMASDFCKKYSPKERIFKHLLNNSISVLYRNGIPVVTTAKVEEFKTAFYEIIEVSSSRPDAVEIVLNFNACNFASASDKPANAVFGITSDEPIVETKNREAMASEKYEIVIADKESPEVFLLTLESNGFCFRVMQAATVNDYRGIRDVVKKSLNNAEDVLKNIMEYNFETHVESLLDFID